MFSVSRFYRRKLARARKRGESTLRKVSDVYPRSPSKELDRAPIDTPGIWKYANLRIKRTSGLRWNTSGASRCFFHASPFVRSVVIVVVVAVVGAKVNILSMRSLLAPLSARIGSRLLTTSAVQRFCAILFDNLLVHSPTNTFPPAFPLILHNGKYLEINSANRKQECRITFFLIPISSMYVGNYIFFQIFLKPLILRCGRLVWWRQK